MRFNSFKFNNIFLLPQYFHETLSHEQSDRFDFEVFQIAFNARAQKRNV